MLRQGVLLGDQREPGLAVEDDDDTRLVAIFKAVHSRLALFGQLRDHEVRIEQRQVRVPATNDPTVPSAETDDLGILLLAIEVLQLHRTSPMQVDVPLHNPIPHLVQQTRVGFDQSPLPPSALRQLHVLVVVFPFPNNLEQTILLENAPLSAVMKSANASLVNHTLGMGSRRTTN